MTPFEHLEMVVRLTHGDVFIAMETLRNRRGWREQEYQAEKILMDFLGHPWDDSMLHRPIYVISSHSTVPVIQEAYKVYMKIIQIQLS